MSDSHHNQEFQWWVFLLVLLLVLALKACYGKLAWNDASCGFKHCVEVKP